MTLDEASKWELKRLWIQYCKGETIFFNVMSLHDVGSFRSSQLPFSLTSDMTYQER